MSSATAVNGQHKGGSKVLLVDVPAAFDEQFITLIFENKRYCGQDGAIESYSEFTEKGKRHVVLEYSDSISAENVVKHGNIVFKDHKFNVKSYSPNNNTNNDNIIQIPSYTYPFYLLEFNQDVLGDFQTRLKQLNAELAITPQHFTIKQQQHQQNNGVTNCHGSADWTSTMKAFLVDFESTRFQRFDLKIDRDDIWFKMSQRACDLYNTPASTVNLILRPEQQLLRIEGKADVVQTESRSLIELYNRLYKKQQRRRDSSS